VTAHNHGFAVKLEEDEALSPEGFGRVQVSHRGLNDNVVEGPRVPRHPRLLGSVPPRGSGWPAR
jgi:carbamoyl-phosphate synthase small subunit